MKDKAMVVLLIIAGLLFIWSLVLQSQVRQMNNNIDELENRIENLTKPTPNFPTYACAVGGKTWELQ